MAILTSTQVTRKVAEALSVSTASAKKILSDLDDAGMCVVVEEEIAQIEEEIKRIDGTVRVLIAARNHTDE